MRLSVPLLYMFDQLTNHESYNAYGVTSLTHHFTSASTMNTASYTRIE
jgi:hypothetical protein